MPGELPEMPLRKPKDDEFMAFELTTQFVVTPEQHMVGVYRAEYTPLTVEQIQAPDAELDELYKNSKHVSR
jgi:hypothetical protein